MSHSRFLSSISVAALCGLGACSDGNCGIGDAADDGLVASSSDLTIAYTNLIAGANNDCPAADAPANVVSLTIQGQQTGGDAGLFTACIPRPDLLGEQTALGTAVTSAFSLVDLSGSSNGCTYDLDRTRPPTGYAQALNLCGNGADKAGFILLMSGAVSYTKKCPGMSAVDVAVTLEGRAAVRAQ